MNKKNSGFLMIEVMVAMMIAALVLIVVIRYPGSLVNFLEKTHRKTKRDMIVSRAHYLIEKDFSSMFIPVLYQSTILVKKNVDATDGAQAKDSEKKTDPEFIGPENKEAPAQEAVVETLDIDPNKKVFPGFKIQDFVVLRSSGELLEQCAFFCGNTFETYSQHKPSVCFVVYRLEALKDNVFDSLVEKNLINKKAKYQLFRYEISDKFSTLANKIKFEELEESKILLIDQVEFCDIVFYYKSSPKKNDGVVQGNAGNDQPAADQEDPSPPEQDTTEKTTRAWPLSEGVSPHDLPVKVIFKIKFYQEPEFATTLVAETPVYCSYRVQATKNRADTLLKPKTDDKAKSTNPGSETENAQKPLPRPPANQSPKGLNLS